MRKKIIITAVVLLSLLLLFIGFLEYRQYSSYKTPIYRNADFILKINADAFIKSFIKAYGFNFREKIKKEEKKDSTESINTGIYPIANIFIYTIKEKKASTFFCTIPLTDEAGFKMFAGKKLGITFSTTNTATAYDGKLTIACSKEYAAIAFSEQKEEVITILTDLLNKRNLLAGSDDLIKKLKATRNHIAFATAKQTGSIEISGNEMLLHATIDDTGNLITPGRVLMRKIVPGDYLSLRLAMKPASFLFKKKYSIKEFDIDTDSLLHNFSGYIDMTISGFTNQVDTIVTYGYDDNFEKKEQRTVVAVQVPDIEITAKADPALLNYLQRQNIATATQVINRDFFPLYKFTIKQDGPTLVLNTNEKAVKNWDADTTPHFFELEINLEKLRPYLDSSSIKKYTGDARYVSITGEKLPAKTQATIDGRIHFESGALKAIENIVRSFPR